MTYHSNLPLPLNSLVGRQAQIAEVKGLLSTTRLLTSTGAGGSGKTRLALAVAAELAPAYPEGLCFVEFAPLSDPAAVPQALAQALAVQETPDQPLVAALVAYLGSRSVLLVLDNCEHLVLACAKLAEALLRACPHLRILCTSREPLGVAGEVLYQVPVLDTPDTEHPPSTPAGYMQFPAVQLFVERAAAAQPSFMLTPENATAVARICRQLDGIPLAIELAASPVRTLSVTEIADRLADNPGLLTAGGRTAPPRQQTLEATLDWSYALLAPAERALLAQLSVFAAGWTLAAAEAVCPEVNAPVLDLLARLVDKSLVIANPHDGQVTRHRLLGADSPIRPPPSLGLGQSGGSQGPPSALLPGMGRGGRAATAWAAAD